MTPATALDSAATASPAAEARTTGGPLRQLSVKQLWRADTPAAVRDAWKRGDFDAAHAEFAKHLAERGDTLAAWRGESGNATRTAGKKPKPKRQAARSSVVETLLWGLPASVRDALLPTVETLDPTAIESAARSDGDRLAERAIAWADSAADAAPTPRFALEAVAWAAAAPLIANVLPANTWWALVERLTQLPGEASQAAAPDEHEPEASVVEQLLAGELPLVLAHGLAELRPLHELAAASREALSAGLERLTDGEGLLAGTLWADTDTSAATALFACWTRCRTLDDSKRGPWTRDAQGQYEWLVRQSLRLADRGGRLAIAAARAETTEPLLHAALDVAGDPSDRVAAALRLRRRSAVEGYETPDVANHSEWAELGVLAAGWRDRAPRMVVAHPGDTMRLEVSAGKRLLLAGDWPVEAKINGKRVEPTDGWDCQCWHTDKDGDYLELALDLKRGARLERQFFLSREDGVGFVAETLFTGRGQPAELEITSRWPLAESIGFRPEDETREGLLAASGEPIAGLLPLDLAEWRDERRGGELDAVGGSLQLTRQWTGRNAASVLWFDFSPSRFAKQRTWRQLTVAESLKRVSHDVAVGYRVQTGAKQWMIYRSLDEAANRTLLGQNLACEALVGRFLKTGEVEEYFEIEAEEA